MRWPWDRNRGLDEIARQERGKLAEAIVRNDRVRNRLKASTSEGSVATLLEEVFRQIEEGKAHE